MRRGLVAVEERATGRGRAGTITLTFADTGPWWDGAINVELFETVLGYSHAAGPARLLLATMAAIAGEDGIVQDVSTEQLWAAAGMTDRTYRRARRTLLASGEVVLETSGVGGRGLRNVWRVPDPRLREDVALPRATKRVPPPPGARPLIAAMASIVTASARPEQRDAEGTKSGQDRTVSAEKRPIRTGVFDLKGGQDRTLFDETPAQTPAETPAPNARAGTEPQNPRTRKDPPSPPGGGSLPDSVTVEQSYVTECGRRRRRLVRIDLDEVRRGLGIPTAADRGTWQRIRELLEETVGETTFAIWLEPAELIAVDSECRLVLAVPSATASWTAKRFGRLLANCSARVGRARG